MNRITASWSVRRRPRRTTHYIVTGNKKDFPFAEFEGAKIVSPAEFAALFIN
jgi:hypothetical protein